MPELLEKFLLAFIPLFVAMDPVGLVPFFLGMTQGIKRPHRNRIAWQAIITAAVVAVGFMFLGRWTFRVLGISVGDFQVAGGLILLVLASRDLLRPSAGVESLPEDFGIVPLGLPYIAGLARRESRTRGRRRVLRRLAGGKVQSRRPARRLQNHRHAARCYRGEYDSPRSYFANIALTLRITSNASAT